MTNKDTLKQVNKIFESYLESNQLRKTPERYAILEEIYALTDHFDVEGLYMHMKAKRYRVSRATVYNTLELLENCDLVTRHAFDKNMATYEKSYGYKQHDHLVCVNCGKILEFCDPRLQQIQTMVGEVLQFKVTHHSLNLYGECAQLQQNGVCANQKMPASKAE